MIKPSDGKVAFLDKPRDAWHPGLVGDAGIVSGDEPVQLAVEVSISKAGAWKRASPMRKNVKRSRSKREVTDSPRGGGNEEPLGCLEGGS